MSIIPRVLNYYCIKKLILHDQLAKDSFKSIEIFHAEIIRE